MHPAALPIETLLKDCTFNTGRVSGPGGQHRNKVDTAVEVVHRPTELSAFGRERRSQKENRSKAIFRLRMRLARDHRERTHPEHHKTSALWKSRRQGKKMPVNPKHPDYPALLAEALDVIHARRHDVAGAAGVLGVSMSQLARLIRHDRKAFGRLNEARQSIGLPALK